MYYIVKMSFPNGNIITVTIPAISEQEARNACFASYPELQTLTIVGKHGA